MPKTVNVAFTDLAGAVRDVISARTAIRLGIATHAEKHAEAIREARREVTRQDAINAGIERATSQV